MALICIHAPLLSTPLLIYFVCFLISKKSKIYLYSVACLDLTEKTCIPQNITMLGLIPLYIYTFQSYDQENIKIWISIFNIASSIPQIHLFSLWNQIEIHPLLLLVNYPNRQNLFNCVKLIFLTGYGVDIW